MTISFSSPVTGAAVSGLTSPTYTLVSDTAPSQNGKQYAVTTLGGTQTNVETHSVSKPFTVTFFRPQVLKTLPAANPVTGIIKDVPMNTYKLITRKGVMPSSGQAPVVARITTTIDVPAGSDAYEPEDLKALASLHIGVLWGETQDVVDAMLTGVI